MAKLRRLDCCTPFARELPETRLIGRSLNTLTAIAITVLGILGLPRAAEACSCGGRSAPSAEYRSAAAVFVAMVETISLPGSSSTVHPDGSVSVRSPRGPTRVRFVITTSYKGGDWTRLEISGDGSSCEFPFVAGQSYLVYAIASSSGLDIHKCTRTRLLSDAVEDVKYLSNLRDGHTQGVVFGHVFRRVQDQNGHPANGMPFEAFDLIAMRDGIRYEARTKPSGECMIVLSPGSYHMWIERDGAILTNPELVNLAAGDEESKFFVVEK